MKIFKGKTICQVFRDNWIALIPYVMFIMLTVIMAVINPNTLSMRWLANKSDATLTLILVAIGQTFVLLTGGFDLSVGGIICVANCLSAVYMGQTAVGIILWVVISLIIGMGIGAFNGYMIQKTRIQPFIVTLATQSVCAGAALLILKIDGGTVSSGYIKVLMYRIGDIPVSMILIGALILLWLFIKRTSFGLSVYAIGSNEKAAHLNGINVMKTKVMVYALSGFFAAFSGLFRTAQVASGSPTAGLTFVMTSISAAVIGGTALTGGKGGVVGSIVGAFVIKSIADVLVFLQVSSYWSSLVQGVLLIIAVAASAFGTLRKGGVAA